MGPTKWTIQICLRSFCLGMKKWKYSVAIEKLLYFFRNHYYPDWAFARCNLRLKMWVLLDQVFQNKEQQCEKAFFPWNKLMGSNTTLHAHCIIWGIYKQSPLIHPLTLALLRNSLLQISHSNNFRDAQQQFSERILILYGLHMRNNGPRIQQAWNLLTLIWYF